MAVFANTDIAVHIQRIIQSHCGNAIRKRPGELRGGRQPAPRHPRSRRAALPAEAARSEGNAGTLAKCGASPSWAVLDGFFFQYLFLIPLLLETPKTPSITGFPLCFKGTRGFYGVVPRLPYMRTHTRTPSSYAAPGRKDTLCSLNKVSKRTRQKVVALNNSFHIASVSHFHF